MRAFWLALLGAGFLLFGGSFSSAGSLKEIRATLETGRYDLAVEQGSALGTADGLVLAAEALNAKLLLGKAERKSKTAKRAMKLAQAALALEPGNGEAQIQYALAYGFYGRHVSNFTAWRKKLPGKILAEIDRAAALSPDDYRVDALKGAWHLNLHYRAGGFDVEKRYGAKEAAGIAYFQSALMKSHDSDIVVYANYLMLHYALAPETRADQTRLLLQTAVLSRKPANLVEQHILAQMQHVYNGFETGSSLELAQAFIEQ